MKNSLIIAKLYIYHLIIVSNIFSSLLSISNLIHILLLEELFLTLSCIIYETPHQLALKIFLFVN